LKNLALSLATIGLQAGLTIGAIALVHRLGYNQLYVDAAVAGSLMLALAFASVAKGRLLQSILGAPVGNWRWALLWAALPAALIGWAAVRFLPEWAQLSFGIVAILGVYAAVIWRLGFGPDDRLLFRRTAPA
jgi:hypothetical protein